MFSGTVLLALASLAGLPPPAAAPSSRQEQAIVSTQAAPAGPQRSTPAPCEPSAFEEEQEDAKRHSSEQPVDCALTPAVCSAALSGWLEAPRGEPFAEALRVAISLGMARGPPALG